MHIVIKFGAEPQNFDVFHYALTSIWRQNNYRLCFDLSGINKISSFTRSYNSTCFEESKFWKRCDDPNLNNCNFDVLSFPNLSYFYSIKSHIENILHIENIIVKFGAIPLEFWFSLYISLYKKRKEWMVFRLLRYTWNFWHYWNATYQNCSKIYFFNWYIVKCSKINKFDIVTFPNLS